MQKVIIKNFGPIVDVELDVQDFMVFIGPQASGKSTIAKVIYFFKSLNIKFYEYILKDINYIKKKNGNIHKDYKIQVSHLIYDLAMDLWDNLPSTTPYMKFFYSDNDWIEIEEFNNSGSMSVILSESFEVKLQKIEKLIVQNFPTITQKKVGLSKTEKIKVEIEEKNILELLQTNLNYLFSNSKKIDFIPASRANAVKLNKHYGESDDYIEKLFIDDVINEVRTSSKKEKDFLINLGRNTIFQNDPYYPILQTAYKLKSTILKGNYDFDENEDIESIKISDKIYIPLENASSGQQESVWILEYIFAKLLKKYFEDVIIEEPEAHLYPEAQKDIVSLIALLSNVSDNQVIITTHSPYILAAVNNLMYAHKVGQKHEKEVSERIDKKLWLDYKRVGAYFVGGTFDEEDNTGKIKNIVDEELGSIENQYLDGISQKINEEFDFMFELD